MEIEIVCSACGSDLDEDKTELHRGNPRIHFAPCKVCLDAAAEEARREEAESE